MEVKPIVRDLAQGFSTQAKIANKRWLAVVVVAILVLAGAEEDGLDIAAIGKIESQFIEVIALAILSALSVAFGSALIQSRIAYDRAMKFMDDMGEDAWHQKRLFDIMVVPTLVGIGPVLNYFYDNVSSKPKRQALRHIYMLTRVLAGMIFFGAPIMAVIYSACDLLLTDKLNMLTKLVSLLVLVPPVTAVVGLAWWSDASTIRRNWRALRACEERAS